MSDEHNRGERADMTTERDQEAGGAAEAADIDQLRAELEGERAKAQSYYQSWQRAAADYQNFKRRVEEDRSEVARFANASLIINLLPLMDDLERALKSVDAHLASLTWVDGIRLIYRKFQALLEMAGVEEIEADGQSFDPSQHEAVSQAPGEDNKVISVVQKGYRLGDRVIRPAMVVVGHGSGAPAAGEEDGE
jgi:molecular chaperone GrpE